MNFKNLAEIRFKTSEKSYSLANFVYNWCALHLKNSQPCLDLFNVQTLHQTWLQCTNLPHDFTLIKFLFLCLTFSVCKWHTCFSSHTKYYIQKRPRIYINWNPPSRKKQYMTNLQMLKCSFIKFVCQKIWENLHCFFLEGFSFCQPFTALWTQPFLEMLLLKKILAHTNPKTRLQFINYQFLASNN